MQLQSQVNEKDKEIQRLRKQVADAEDRERHLTQQHMTHHKTSEELMQKILASVMHKVIKADASMQTECHGTSENATQCHAIEHTAQETQTIPQALIPQSVMPQAVIPRTTIPQSDATLFQREWHRHFNAPRTDQNFPYSAFYAGQQILGGAQYIGADMSRNATEGEHFGRYQSFCLKRAFYLNVDRFQGARVR